MNYYNEISETYIQLHREEQLRKINLIKQHISIESKDLLLDLGCGPYFADWPCQSIGVDPAFELLRKAKIKTVCASAENLPFRNNVFDWIASITAIHNFIDYKKALEEAIRVGKSNFIFTILKKSARACDIEMEINRLFDVRKKIIEHHDIILIAKYKNNH